MGEIKRITITVEFSEMIVKWNLVQQKYREPNKKAGVQNFVAFIDKEGCLL